MNQFESLEDELYGSENITIERPKLNHANGYYRRYGSGFAFIAVSSDLTLTEAKCTAFHEAGHHYTLNENDNEDRNELRADIWAAKRLIPVSKLVEALTAGCRNSYEASEHLEVTERFLQKTLEIYKKIYGDYYGMDEWTVSFKPLMAHNYITDQIYPAE